MNKFSVLSLLGVFLAVLAVASGYQRTMHISTLLHDSSKICMQKIADENYDVLGGNHYDSNSAHDSHRCYHSCVWKNTGLFANNEFDLENMAPNAREVRNPHVRRQYRTLMYGCVGAVNHIGDECEKATRYTRCLRTMVGHKSHALTKLRALMRSYAAPAPAKQ